MSRQDKKLVTRKILDPTFRQTGPTSIHPADRQFNLSKLGRNAPFLVREEVGRNAVYNFASKKRAGNMLRKEPMNHTEGEMRKTEAKFMQNKVSKPVPILHKTNASEPGKQSKLLSVVQASQPGNQTQLLDVTKSVQYSKPGSQTSLLHTSSKPKGVGFYPFGK